VRALGRIREVFDAEIALELLLGDVGNRMRHDDSFFR
jgi:hypothetical protein